MKSITINGSKRENVGKKATKALRNAEKVPCVLYGGEAPIHFSAEKLAFKKLIYTPNVYTAKIKLEDGTHNAIVQDIQFHPVSDEILHIDFRQLFDDKLVIMNIPVKLEGNAPGVINGGSLRFPLRKLTVKALPGDLPDSITADISKLEIGNKLYVTELAKGNFELLHPDNSVVAQVKMARSVVLTEEDETASEGAEGTEGAAATEEKSNA